VNPTAQPLVVPLLLEVIESVRSFVPTCLSFAASRPLGQRISDRAAATTVCAAHPIRAPARRRHPIRRTTDRR
jgi:hypothetical protein